MVKEIIAAISSGKKFLITAHVRLDGDALGSELALYRMLKDLGKEAVIYNQDTTPDHYRFLPGTESIVHKLDRVEKYDVGFVLDCSELERIGEVVTDVVKIKTLINVDHHVSNGGFCKLQLLDPKASSTGELLYRLMRKMHVKMTRDICTNLYAAILTDTGGFRYSSTHQDTLRAAGDLVEGGADPQWISENIYESDPPAKLKLLAKVLETLELDMALKTGSMIVTQEQLQQTGATMEHTDGFIDIPRTVKGVNIAMLYSQMGDGKFKLSLRSKGKVNVEKIAAQFGGGGHINAAACRIEGDIAEIKARVQKAIRELQALMDGIVVIDKPAGLTSHDVVSEVKKILNARKAGHTGTLDPMATGVLPVCLNEATKLAQFLSADNKTYRATMLLGIETDTQDAEGKIIAQSPPLVSEEEIREALARMVGKIKQVPPAFSAVKHKGKPLYKYARAGEFPEMPTRNAEIFSLEIRSIYIPYVTFDVSCSKGTYIRTVCSDVGHELGCGACLSALRRLRSGFFTEEMAVSLEIGSPAEKKRNLLTGLMPMAQALPSYTALAVSQSESDKLRSGFQPDVEMLRQNVLPFLAAGDMIKIISPDGHLVAVAQMQMPVSAMGGQDGRARAARVLRVFKEIYINNK